MRPSVDSDLITKVPYRVDFYNHILLYLVFWIVTHHRYSQASSKGDNRRYSGHRSPPWRLPPLTSWCRHWGRSCPAWRRRSCRCPCSGWPSRSLSLWGKAPGAGQSTGGWPRRGSPGRNMEYAMSDKDTDKVNKGLRAKGSLAARNSCCQDSIPGMKFSDYSNHSMAACQEWLLTCPICTMYVIIVVWPEMRWEATPLVRYLGTCKALIYATDLISTVSQSVGPARHPPLPDVLPRVCQHFFVWEKVSESF